MPKADSKKRKVRQIKQVIPVIGLYVFATTIKANMVADKAMHIVHANLFCLAPTYSGV
jgi:hypothetical protein